VVLSISVPFTIQTPLGPMLLRTGFSLHETGSVRSVEPAVPVALATPIGPVKAFDAEMLGMNADQNSVRFSPAGSLISVKAVHTGIRVFAADHVETIIEPLETTSLIEIAPMRTVPMKIVFDGSTVVVAAKHTHHFDVAIHTFAPSTAHTSSPNPVPAVPAGNGGGEGRVRPEAARYPSTVADSFVRGAVWVANTPMHTRKWAIPFRRSTVDQFSK
jgi:hypothetical protein